MVYVATDWIAIGRCVLGQKNESVRPAEERRTVVAATLSKIQAVITLLGGVVLDL